MSLCGSVRTETGYESDSPHLSLLNLRHRQWKVAPFQKKRATQGSAVDTVSTSASRQWKLDPLTALYGQSHLRRHTTTTQLPLQRHAYSAKLNIFGFWAVNQTKQAIYRHNLWLYLIVVAIFNYLLQSQQFIEKIDHQNIMKIIRGKRNIFGFWTLGSFGRMVFIPRVESPETKNLQGALKLVWRLVVAQPLTKTLCIGLSLICSSNSPLNMLWSCSLKTFKSVLKQNLTAEIPKLEWWHLARWYQLKPESASLSLQPNPLMEEAAEGSTRDWRGEG